MLMVIMLVHIKVACWLQSVEHHVYNTSWRSRMRFMAEKVVVRCGGRMYSAFCTLYGAPHCIIHSWTKRIDIDCDYSVSNPWSLPRSCKIGMAGDAWCFCYMFQYVPICSNMFQCWIGQSRTGFTIFTELYNTLKLRWMWHFLWRFDVLPAPLLEATRPAAASPDVTAAAKRVSMPSCLGTRPKRPKVVQNVVRIWCHKRCPDKWSRNAVFEGIWWIWVTKSICFILLTSSCWQNITEL